jgi:hypothetical protein
MIDELKEFGRRRLAPNGGTTSAFAWRDWSIHLFVLK